jgi:hypothetical protein
VCSPDFLGIIAADRGKPRMNRFAALCLGLTASAAVMGCAGFAPAPHERAYAVVNDGVFTVTSLQVRVGAGWSDNLLAAPVKPGETYALKLPDDGRPCLVDLAVNTDARSMNTFLFDENVCERPQFHAGGHFDPQDMPGNGRGGRGRPDLERGVPLCPGDVRCRRK